MSIKKIILLAALAFGISLPSEAQQKEITPAQIGVQYGKKVDKAGAITVEKLEKSLEKSPKFTGKVSGKVVQVCTKKGCFLTLQRTGEKDPLMVRFTDYSYFVPADLIGKNVVLDGYAKVKESTNEITFIADGVLVVK
ncbi:DUF4920 domain-containing protein [Sphingobacterium sp. SG20118]|uniref:DUF4920 domain-containing protein n=1 Tax=Sphingobacterium TaxID=28453 RepID=UPI00068DDD3A|nr:MULTISPECIES: DUF4920 domain-containing protein [Sphingobacterium]MDH5828366.1 DUF4920 domain-containing protein [Sphingobacterium faecium]